MFRTVQNVCSKVFVVCSRAFATAREAFHTGGWRKFSPLPEMLIIFLLVAVGVLVVANDPRYASSGKIRKGEKNRERVGTRAVPSGRQPSERRVGGETPGINSNSDEAQFGSTSTLDVDEEVEHFSGGGEIDAEEEDPAQERNEDLRRRERKKKQRKASGRKQGNAYDDDDDYFPRNTDSFAERKSRPAPYNSGPSSNSMPFGLDPQTLFLIVLIGFGAFRMGLFEQLRGMNPFQMMMLANYE